MFTVSTLDFVWSNNFPLKSLSYMLFKLLPETTIRPPKRRNKLLIRRGWPLLPDSAQQSIERLLHFTWHSLTSCN